MQSLYYASQIDLLMELESTEVTSRNTVPLTGLKAARPLAIEELMSAIRRRPGRNAKLH